MANRVAHVSVEGWEPCAGRRLVGGRADSEAKEGTSARHVTRLVAARVWTGRCFLRKEQSGHLIGVAG